MVLVVGYLSEAFAQYVVHGRKLPWQMTAAEEWIGGSYEEIDKVGRESQNAKVRELSRAMLQEAIGLDVYLIHLDVQGLVTRTPTSLRVNVAGGFSLADLKEAWTGYAEVILKDQPAGSTARVVSRDSLSIGGFNAREGVIKIVRPDGGKLYHAISVALLSTTRSHIFRLTADETKFESAYRDYRTMLASVRYN